MRRRIPLRPPTPVIALGVLMMLLLAGCGGPFPQSALHPESDFAWKLQDLFRGIFWWAVVVFVLVEGALLLVILKFRERKGRGAPEAVHGHTLLEVAWTLAPAIVLVIIAVPTIRTIWEVDSPPTGDALVVDVIGHQWWWEFRYPDLGVVTANELHIPVGTTVDLRLTSADVIHSFWIPRLGGKRDVIPGHETEIWFAADSTGRFTGQCAEFCGLSHALMKMEVVVEEPDAFAAWIANQRRPAVSVAPAADSAAPAVSDVGLRSFLASGCAACHRIAGTPAVGAIGPDLTHVASRARIAAGVLKNEPEEMARWLRAPETIKPGVRMPNLGLDEERVRVLVEYLASLK